MSGCIYSVNGTLCAFRAIKAGTGKSMCLCVLFLIELKGGIGLAALTGMKKGNFKSSTACS